MPQRKKRLLVIGSLVLTAMLLVSVRHVLPSGLGGMKQVVPYVFFSQSRGVFTSPSGTHRVEVITNDAGAAHSGSFPTWVIVRRWWGKEVVAKGYLKVSQGDVPIVWSGEKSFTIMFAKQRYADEEEAIGVEL